MYQQQPKMPGQFINVKHGDIQSTTIYPEVVKKQESLRYESSSNISNSNNDICRICHCEADIGNPLLSPCYCAGSLKYVHQSCLQQWLAASDTRSCELCKFHFILHTKIKPIGEWRRLEMSSVERRRLLCAILFHFVAAICVVWSLFVLIDRAAEEVQKGLIAWPFWTKLVVVAVGFTGGAVFMYIQCRQYLHLFSRWKAHNRIILVQNAPEKTVIIDPPSPNFNTSRNGSTERGGELSSQVIANVEHNLSGSNVISNRPLELNYVFESRKSIKTNSKDNISNIYVEYDSGGSNTSTQKSETVKNAEMVALAKNDSNSNKLDNVSVGGNSCDALELNIQEILALDIEFNKRYSTSSGGGCVGNFSRSATDKIKPKQMFKSLPNLSASSENLLV